MSPKTKYYFPWVSGEGRIGFMKQTVKRILCFAVAVVLCATLFASCGKNGNNGSSASAGAASLEEVLNSIPEELKGTTIKYYSWYDLENEDEWPVIKAFEEKTGITVEYERGPWDGFITALTAKVSTGEAPDLVYYSNPTVYAAKLLTPLDEIDFDFSDAAWDQTTMKDYTFGGKAYATNIVNTSAFDPMVVYYNKEAFEENDIEFPYDLYKKGEWTWSKFEEICETYAGIDDGNYGASIEPIGLYPLSRNQSLVNYEDGKYSSNLDNPLLISTWRTTLEWINKGYIGKEVCQISDFMSGKCGMLTVSMRSSRAKNTTFRKFMSKGNLGVAPIPVDDSKDAKNYTPLVEYCAYGIPKGAKNGNAVPYFLRYVLDNANYPDIWPEKEFEELYNELLKSENRTCGSADGIITEDNGMDAGGIIYRIKTTDPQQIQTTLASWSGVVNDAVSKANSEIDKLGK